MTQNESGYESGYENGIDCYSNLNGSMQKKLCKDDFINAFGSTPYLYKDASAWAEAYGVVTSTIRKWLAEGREEIQQIHDDKMEALKGKSIDGVEIAINALTAIAKGSKSERNQIESARVLLTHYQASQPKAVGQGFEGAGITIVINKPKDEPIIVEGQSYKVDIPE